MTTEDPANTTEPLLPIGQGGPPSGGAQPPPTPAMPSIPTTPSIPATPPVPPRGRLAASIQRMSPGWRWALGLGLALLSGFVYVAWPSEWSAINVVLTLALALAAGIVLTNWWAALALDAAAMAGAFVGIWVNVQVSPDATVLGLTGMDAVLSWFAFFAVFGVPAFLVVFLGGVGLGKLQGLALGQPHALSAGEATASRWIAALAPTLVAGWLAYNNSGVTYVNLTSLAQGDVWRSVMSLLVALMLSTTCLLAGWLLRSWWGVVVATLAYAGPTFVVGGGLENWVRLPFALYIVLLAVVMSAIGTAIGRYGAGPGRERGGQQPPQGAVAA